jgi:hypothetical protein
MTSTQPLPLIGSTVTFIAAIDGLPFTGRVFKSYGFAVAVAAISPDATLPVTTLDAGQPYTLVTA